MNTAVALREKLAEGDLAWIRASFAAGDLNFLRDKLAAGDRIEFARHLAQGDLPWIRTVLSAVEIDGVGRLAGPGSMPEVAPIQIVAAAPDAPLHPVASLVETRLLAPPPAGIAPLPMPVAIPSPSVTAVAKSADNMPLVAGGVAATASTASVVDVALHQRPSAPFPPSAEAATSQIAQTSSTFNVGDKDKSPKKEIDLGRPRRRWPWLLLVPLLLIGAAIFLKNRKSDSPAASTVAPTTTFTAATPETTTAPASTVAPGTTLAAATTPTPASTTAAATTTPASTTTAAPTSTLATVAPTTASPAPVPSTPAAPQVLASVLFNSGSADLTPEARTALAKLAADLKAKGIPANLTVTAYVDPQGSAVSANTYMDERNDAVVRELQRLGITAKFKAVRGGVANRRVDIANAP
jgi:outer membrane protein OmpA-like peptidoglycan-associated protein